MGEPIVVCAGNDPHLGEPRLEIGHRAITRVIVYDEDLGIHSLESSMKCVKTLLHIIFDVVGDHYHREFLAHRSVDLSCEVK